MDVVTGCVDTDSALRFPFTVGGSPTTAEGLLLRRVVVPNVQRLAWLCVEVEPAVVSS